MGQIVVDLAHLMAAVYVVLILWRTLAQLLAKRLPSVSHAIEFGIGK